MCSSYKIKRPACNTKLNILKFILGVPLGYKPRIYFNEKYRIQDQNTN